METLKNRVIILLGLFVVGLLILLWTVGVIAIKYRDEANRQELNIEAITDSTTRKITKLGHEVSSTKSLLLTKEELLKSQDSRLVTLSKHIKDMEVKYCKLQSAGLGSIVIKDTFEVKLHDTIYHDTSGLLREIKTGIYSDPWTVVSMTIEKDTLRCSYHTSDTLVYTTSIKKRGKWSFKNIIPFNGRKKELVVDAKLTRKNATLVLWNVNILK